MTNLTKSLLLLGDVCILLWVQLYGWGYILGIVGQPSTKVLTIFVFLAVIWAGATNLRLRTGNFVPGDKKEIA